MKVHGDNKPEKISANVIPNKPGRAWVRICLNAEQEFDENNNPIGWVYDEYTTEVEYTPNLQEEVEANYDRLLAEAKANEKSKADLVADNESLQQENSKLKERQAFLEDCIAEMASQVYA